MTEKQIKRLKFTIIWGTIVGLVGLTFFIYPNVANLFCLSFLSYLSLIPMYRELRKGVDERTKENIAKSDRVFGRVALIALVIIGFVPGTSLPRYFDMELTPLFFVGIASIGFACAVLAKVGSFFYFERKL